MQFLDVGVQLTLVLRNMGIEVQVGNMKDGARPSRLARPRCARPTVDGRPDSFGPGPWPVGPGLSRTDVQDGHGTGPAAHKKSQPTHNTTSAHQTSGRYVCVRYLQITELGRKTLSLSTKMLRNKCRFLAGVGRQNAPVPVIDEQRIIIPSPTLTHTPFMQRGACLARPRATAAALSLRALSDASPTPSE